MLKAPRIILSWKKVYGCSSVISLVSVCHTHRCFARHVTRSPKPNQSRGDSCRGNRLLAEMDVARQVHFHAASEVEARATGAEMKVISSSLTMVVRVRSLRSSLQRCDRIRVPGSD